MKQEINTIKFEKNDPEFIEFFNEHGWVVLQGNLASDVIQGGLGQWANLKQRYADEMGLSLVEYENEVSQWRNLWHNEKGYFRDLIYTPVLHECAWESMGWEGARLLHDHIICKPHKGHNDKIPWHQDSMFWPVNSPGISTWTPFLDVTLEDGCLEVVDRSHLGGCSSPVDFMAKEKDEFPEDSVQVFLPVSAGDTVLLHSLSWHRSSPNKGNHDRPVHIGLWIHSDSKWRPDLVDWHPVNEHVEAEPMKRLEGELFPSFGALEELVDSGEDIHGGTVRHNSISMYDASKIVAKQMKTITGSMQSLPEILGSQSHVQTIIEATIELGFSDDEETVREALKRLEISFSAYEMHRARNVYNSAYSNWWEVAGHRWYTHLQTTVGVVGLGSVGDAAFTTFSNHFHTVGYDVDGRGNWKEILASDVAIVCVPTNAADDGKLDMSNVMDVSKNLAEDEFTGLMIIKSTLQPSTMDAINKKFPHLRAAYAPEFLREKDALEWFKAPDRLVYSCANRDETLLLDYFSWIDDEVPRIRMKHLEAEIGKLAHNAYIATKVTFTVEIERLANHFGVDPDPVMETVWRDRRVNNPAHLTPKKGGFAGKCVPKDTAALAQLDPDTGSILHMLSKRGSDEAHRERMKNT
jgi:UDPglucose 6-dehydrogenase